MPSARTAAASVAALLLAACGSVPAPVLPAEVPAAWLAAPAGPPTTPAPDLQSWWKTLNDPLLDTLVDRALAQNLTLAQARSRLRQARQLAGRDEAQYLPALSANLRTLQDVAVIDNYFHAGVDATWELGLFGARESAARGGQARLALAVAGEQAAKVSMIAELVRQYLLMRAAQHEETQLQRLLALDERALALHAARQRSRLGTLDEKRAVELRQAQGRAALPAPRQAAAAARQALAVLLAQTAPDAAWAQPAPAPPSVNTLGALQLQQVPADLLRFRPDIRTAEAEVAQATSELGLARAELYPRVVLGLSYLYAYNITQNRRNLNADLPAFGPSVDIPLFDWGRRRAQADAREEALNAALLAYRQAVVEAVGETETALSALAQAGDRAARLADAQQLAERQLAQQSTRVRLGLASELDRVEAERAVLQAGLERAAAERARELAFVLVYKALGGAPLGDAQAGSAALAQGAPPKAAP